MNLTSLLLDCYIESLYIDIILKQNKFMKYILEISFVLLLLLLAKNLK